MVFLLTQLLARVLGDGVERRQLKCECRDEMILHTRKRALVRFLSLSITPASSYERSLFPSLLAPHSKLSHSPAHISPRPPLSLTLAPPLPLSLYLTHSLSPWFYRLLSLSLSHALFLSSPKLPSTCPLGFKAGWGEEEGEGDGTTRGSIAAARPFGKIFCGGVGAPHRYIYKGMYRNLAHTAHTHLRTHPLTHSRRNCTISRTNSHYDDRVYL